MCHTVIQKLYLLQLPYLDHEFGTLPAVNHNTNTDQYSIHTSTIHCFCSILESMKGGGVLHFMERHVSEPGMNGCNVILSVNCTPVV